MTAPPVLPRQDGAERAVDLIAVLDTLWSARALVLKTAAAVLLLGLAYAFLATPTYRADLLLRLDADTSGAQLLGPLSEVLGGKSTSDAEILILRSRRVVAAAVEKTRYDIEAEPKRFPLLGRLAGLAGWQAEFDVRNGEAIDVDRFDLPRTLYDTAFVLTAGTRGRYSLAVPGMAHPFQGQVGTPLALTTADGAGTLLVRSLEAAPGTAFVLRRRSRQQSVADLQEQLVIVDRAKESGVLSVSLESVRPHRAAALVNAIGAAYIQMSSEQKAAQAAKSLDFLERQLPEMKRELQLAEDALLVYRNRHHAIDLGESAKLQLGQAVALETRLSLLEQERRAKLQELTPQHPDIASIDAQAAGLKRELGALDAQLRRLPDTEQALVRLTRDVRVNTELYVAMLNSAQQLRLLKAGKVANVYVVDEAVVAERPVKPRRALVVAGALLLGLLAGIGLALARSLWREAVTDPRELEDALGVPVVASVPLAMPARRHRLRRARRIAAHPPLALAQPHAPAIEGLRSLCVALRLNLLDARGNVLLLTSPAPGAGKSFVSANLAVVLAQSGHRVLLIDGDLRRGVLAEAFQADTGTGLTQVLRGELPLAEAIQPAGVEGLDLVVAGAPAADPLSLLQRAPLAEILAGVAGRYDVVLLDSAPLLPVADTLLLARHVDLVYALARHGVTSEAEMTELYARLKRAGVSLDGAILNGVQAGLRARPYAAYGYGVPNGETAVSAARETLAGETS